MNKNSYGLPKKQANSENIVTGGAQLGYLWIATSVQVIQLKN